MAQNKFWINPRIYSDFFSQLARPNPTAWIMPNDFPNKGFSHNFPNSNKNNY